MLLSTVPRRKATRRPAASTRRPLSWGPSHTRSPRRHAFRMCVVPRTSGCRGLWRLAVPSSRRLGDRGGRVARRRCRCVQFRPPTCVGWCHALWASQTQVAVAVSANWPFHVLWPRGRGRSGVVVGCGGGASLWYRTSGRGAWRSLVAHPAGGRAVGGSNPLAPTHVEGKPRTTRLRWLPNAITILRLAALPVLAWFLAVDDGPTSARAAVVLRRDRRDGLHRRASSPGDLGAESKFGAIADPFADRMLMAVGLIGLITLRPVLVAGAHDHPGAGRHRRDRVRRARTPGRRAARRHGGQDQLRAWRCSPLGWRS